jgi:hypothetical protein
MLQKRRPSLSEDNDEDFKEFCDLFTFYLCRYCCKDVSKWHPIPEDWIFGHHNAKLLKRLLPMRHQDMVDGIMSAFDAYQRAGEKVFLEDEIADAYGAGSSRLNTHTNLYRVARFFADHHDKTFICHGVEELDKTDYRSGAQYPPLGSMMDLSVAENRVSYAIETDRLPLRNCFSSHSIIDTWDYCTGIIPVGSFRKFNGEIIVAPDRDHFYAESQIPVDKWCFVYFKQTRRKKGLKFDVDDMRREIQNIKASDLRNIEWSTLQSLLRLLALLRQKFELAEMMRPAQAA